MSERSNLPSWGHFDPEHVDLLPSWQELARDLAAAADSVICVANLEGRIVFVNKTVAELSTDRVVGASIYDFVHPDHRHVVEKHAESVVSTGKPVVYEMPPLDDVYGSWFSIHLGPLRKEGAIVGLIFVIDDISDTIKLQERALHSDRLALVGQLAASVAHEINNPLTYLTTSMERLTRIATELEGESAAMIKRLVAMASEGAERIRSVTQDLAGLSRKKKSIQTPLDVRQVMESSLRMASTEIACRASLVKEFAEDVPIVKASESRLGQVFLNLLLNAVQATEEGRKSENEITVRIERDSDGRALIQVSDTGHGIPSELVGHILDPFVTTKREGTGLGLHICRDIVASLEGELSIANNESGKGATVLVRLPSHKRSISEKKWTMDGPASIAPLSVLVVDDEPAILDVLTSLLEGHHLTMAKSGREAISTLEASASFDLVICDLIMPDGTGADVYEHLRTQKSPLVDSFVFMTGGAFTPQSREYLEKANVPCLEKPFTYSEVDALLLRATRR